MELHSSKRPSPLIVGVAAASGDLAAFEQLSSVLSERAKLTVILIEQFDPQADARLTEVVSSATGLRTVSVEDGQKVEPNTIYVAPPASQVTVVEGRLHLDSELPHAELDRRIDCLFGSLAREYGPRTVGVLLSGAAGDGTDGCREIKGVGGLTIVHEPKETSQPGAVENVELQGVADLIACIDDIPQALERFANLSAETAESAAPEATSGEPAGGLGAQVLDQLTSVLASHSEFNLKSYKSGTIHRRVLRRMALTGFGDVEDYIESLRNSPHEQHALIQDMFIGVTEFFRDPQAFESLRTTVVDPLVAAAQHGQTLRVWVPGCATGQEAYSIAMLFLESMSAEPTKDLQLQVFATDVDEEALKVARKGRYPSTIREQISDELLERYFRRESDDYQVNVQLRDALSFAVQDLSQDPPFSRMDLVSCRNVLIYFRPEAQAHILEVLHFALQPEGALFLGSSESVSRQKRRFSTVSKEWKIYRKIGLSRPLSVRNTLGQPTSSVPTVVPLRDAPSPTASRRGHSRSSAAQRAVMSACVPPTIVVTDDGEIIFTHGELGPFLQFPQGEPIYELNSMVRPALTTHVRSALSRCRRQLEATSTVAPLLGRGREAHGEQVAGDVSAVQITACPAPQLGDGAVILTFEQVDQEFSTPREPSDPDEKRLVEQLECELHATQEDLRDTVEELEASNEEIRASHEESLSMNEELQSANEELEASSEELRSLNEELGIVNAQLREKVEQVEQVNDDLSNFIASTQIATIFLDEHLRIKRFTPSARDLLHLERDDEGRFVGDIARPLFQNALVDQAREVLEQLQPQVCELQTPNGRWITRRVLPYRTEDRRIDGVVVTLIDVTDLKKTTNQLAARERQQAVIARLGLQALEETNLEMLLDQIVREVQQTLDTDYCKILELQPGHERLLLRAGVGWTEGLVGEATIDTGLDSQAGFTLRSPHPVIVEDLSREKRFSGPQLLVDHGVTSGISCVIRDADGIYGVFGAHTKDLREFTNEDTIFLQAIAAIVAASIGRHYARARMVLEAEVAKAVTTASNIDEVVSTVHGSFAQVLDTSIGELWWHCEDADILECRAISAEPHYDVDNLRANFCNQPMARGDGLVGRVFESGQPEWLTTLDLDARFLRSDQLRSLGLSMAIAFPILVGEQVHGVITVYSKKNLVANRLFLQSLASIGRVVGEFVRRDQAERARRENERRFSEVFAHAGVSLWEQDFSQVGAALDRLVDDGVTDLAAYFDEHPEFVDEVIELIDVVDVNQETLRLFGATDKAELLSNFGSLFSEEGRETFVSQLLAFATNETFFASEARMRKLDGQEFETTFTVRFPPSDGRERVLVSVMDISELKQTQHDLEESRRWLARITESTPDAIAVADRVANQFIYTNGKIPDLLGYTAEELEAMGDNAAETLIHPDDMAAYNRFYAELPSHGEEGAEQTYRLKHADGSYRWMQRRAVPFEYDEDGQLRQVLLVGRDITELKRVETELQEASDQKDEFLAMLGHELRNPLAAVRSASESLKLTEGSDERLQRIQGILERQTSHMAKLLDGLLDVSRIVRGKIALEREDVDLVSILKYVVEDLRDQIDKCQLDLEVDLPETPVLIDGDAVRLTQVFDNLLSNAIKYTEAPGTVSLALSCQEGEAVVEVSDTGTGITPDLLPHVFETFRQARQSIDRGSGGLGLGLALVKGLTELHGGSVTASSDGKGEGATFVVRLPVTSGPSLRGDVAKPSDQPHPKRILLVEDNVDAASLLHDLLTLKGHEVALAADGTHALERAENFQPDVVLCDLGLPGGVSGYDVAQSLRERDKFDDTLLVAVTGYGRPEDERRSLEAGFDAHTTKPVDMATIEQLLTVKPN